MSYAGSIIGIDPGLSGALALWRPSTRELSVEDMPTLSLPKAGGKLRKEVDLYALARILDLWCSGQGVVAYVERVNPSPRIGGDKGGPRVPMGATAAFSFDGSYWTVRMGCACNFIRHEVVLPQTWKKALTVPAAKDGARARASVLLPEHSHLWRRVKDDGRAEAALIAVYGAQKESAA